MDKNAKRSILVGLKVVCLCLSLFLFADMNAWAQDDVSSEVKTFIEALKDEDWKVRRRAAIALGEIGPAAKAAVPALTNALKDTAPKVRRLAARALGEIGPAAGNLFYLKLAVAALLLLFLPLLSFTYYRFRRGRRISEDKRRLKTLDLLDQYDELAEYDKGYGVHLVLAVLFLSFVVAIGVGVLFFPTEIGLDESSFGEFPQKGSRLVVGMAFLGAYLWGLQYLIRRYYMNDLIPGLYYRIGLRIFLAAAIALLIANAFEALGDGSDSRLDERFWPAVAFLIGMFPQRGMQWLTARIPLFTPRPDPSVRELPLEMIEGVSNYDKIRLEELGIDDCHDLADEDFVPLTLKTPYSARQLISWILQAKLCVHAGAGVKALREHNIRRITDLKDLSPNHLNDLAAQTPCTKEGLERAKKALDEDQEIGRLVNAALLLGQYTKIESVGDH